VSIIGRWRGVVVVLVQGQAASGSQVWWRTIMVAGEGGGDGRREGRQEIGRRRNAVAGSSERGGEGISAMTILA